ncbi:MAG TPA: SDR family oxidoreductase [Pseudolysinimonas sp.]|jgi:nucleoside-diphosphate-sugar epimerase
MKYFVTGASGWIGSHVTAELIAHGHQVVGLARTDDSAAKIQAAGAEVFRGSIDEPDALRAPAEASDGVIHLAFNHDFSAHLAAVETDRAAVTALLDTLVGSDRPFVFASGVLGRAAAGVLATEDMAPDPATVSSPRLLTELLALDYADKGVRPISVAFAPTVHGEGDHGFMSAYVGMDRLTGAAGYVGDGANTWPAVNIADAAALVALGVENAPARSVLHAVGEQGVTHRDIASAIGRQTGLPVRAFAEGEVAEKAPQFVWLERFLGVSALASSAKTQAMLGWAPTHPTLIEDLDAGYYTR